MGVAEKSERESKIQKCGSAPDAPHGMQASNVPRAITERPRLSHNTRLNIPPTTPTHLTLCGIDGNFFPLSSSLFRVRVRIVIISIKDLFPVPVELLDKLLHSLRTPGADGAVIDAKHLQRRL